MTIEELRNSGRICYEYRRGSHMYHLNTETSDEDTGGVFFCPGEKLLGLREFYPEQVADEKNDTVFYEFGRWVELLIKSNPSALESLFAPDDCVIGGVHPIIQEFRNHRDLFLTKECFKPFYSYATTQIGKARGYNKKCHIPEDFQRKDILDFCYTFKNQGSQPIKDFLKEHNLDQRYCGLVNIPNMKDVYGVYYDFAAYFKFENIGTDERVKIYKMFQESPGSSSKFIMYDILGEEVENRISEKIFFHYKGIVEPDEITKSNDVRLSSIPKGEEPICFMTYNKDGYMSHCRDYKEWAEWKQKRNPVRYESNLGHNYDSKNIMHCMRLVRMAKEIAQGKGFNVVRNEDREYLLDIRNHKYEYEEVMAQLEKEKAEFEEALKTCTLPEKVDIEKVNNLLKYCRSQYYGWNY